MTPTIALRVAEVHARAYRRVWKGSIFTSFVTPTLFLAGMGLGLGTLVDSGTTGVLERTSYLTFIAPGLLAAACMQTASGEATFPVFAGIKWVKTYHAALATPVGVPELVGGTLAWLVVRLVMTALMFVAVMVAFGATSLADGLAAVPAATLTGIAYAVPILAFTTQVDDETRLVALFRFAIMPMFLFSGTFFPVEQLPGWLQPVALVTPLWHGVELCRAVALDRTPALDPSLHVAYLVLWSIPGWWIAKRGLERRLLP